MAAGKFTVTFIARLGHVYHFCGAQFVQGPFLPFYFLFFFFALFLIRLASVILSACCALRALQRMPWGEAR